MTFIRVCSPILVVCALEIAARGQNPILKILDEPLPASLGAVEVAADFDNDGDVDCLTDAGIFLNDGQGRLKAAPVPVLAYRRNSIVAADFNGDGLVDVVSIENTLTPRVEINLGSLAFATLSGAFPALPASYVPWPPPAAWGLCAGDIDGDGDVDLLAQVRLPTGYHSSYQPAAPILLLNNGTGIFSVAPASVFPTGPIASDGGLLADFDGDGDLDIALGNFGGIGAQPITVGWNGGASFTFTPLSSPGLMGMTSFTEGDFNGDGRRDLVVLSQSPAGKPVYGLRFGTAVGLASPVISPAPDWGQALIPVDLTADGRDELLAVLGPSGLAFAHAVSASGSINSPSAPHWGVSVPFPVGNWRVGLRPIADFDGDGDQDVCVRSSGSSAMLWNDGSGSPVMATGRVAGTGHGAVPAVGDFDGDGDADVARWTSSTTLGISLNDGHGFFSAGASTTLSVSNSAFLSLHPFDRDGDGDSDLYVARSPMNTFGLPGNHFLLDCEDGEFTIASTLPDYGPVAVVRDLDVDGDGDPDILLGRRAVATSAIGPAGPMLLLVNLGGSFAPATPIGLDLATYDLEIADFDRNGTLDVFQLNSTYGAGGTFSVLYLNDGTGVFTAYPQIAISGFFASSGDLNGDSLPDLIVDGAVWFNSAGSSFAIGPSLPSALTAPADLVDLDRDGDLDLVETPATVMINSGGGSFGPPVYETVRYATPPFYPGLATSVVLDLDLDDDQDVIGGDGRIHLNTGVQLALGARARPGRPASLELYGTPGGLYFLFASTATADILLSPSGRALIDPSLAQLIRTGTFAAQGLGNAGMDTFELIVPSIPSLVGQSLHWQLIESSGRLSNRATTTVAGY